MLNAKAKDSSMIENGTDLSLPTTITSVADIADTNSNLSLLPSTSKKKTMKETEKSINENKEWNVIPLFDESKNPNSISDIVSKLCEISKETKSIVQNKVKQSSGLKSVKK